MSFFIGFSLVSSVFFPFIFVDSSFDFNPLLEPSHIIEVDDFSLFSHHRNSLMVDSVLSNNSLHFSYNENYSTLNEESYIYNFGSFGTCSDFSFTMNLDYSYINHFGKLEIIFGDYYQGSFRGLYFCSIYDLYDFQTGTYETIALFAPYLYEWRSGGLLLSDSITFNMFRIGDLLGLSISSESELKVSNSYNLYDAILVSFIIINFTPHSGGYTGDDFSFDFTDFSAELEFENHSPIDPGGFAILLSNPIIIVLLSLFFIGFLGAFFYVFLVRARKRKKSKLEDKAEFEDFDIHAESSDFSLSDSTIKSVFNKELIPSVVPNAFKQTKYGIQNCVICKIKIKEYRIFYKCPNCHSYFHEKHLKIWLMKANNCPVCHLKLVLG